MKRKVTQVEAFNYFMSKRDFEMAFDILCTNFTVQGTTKDKFIEELKLIVKEFGGKDDLVVVTGPCYCLTHQGLQGVSYIDIHNNVFLNLVIQSRDGNILDISRCHSFEKPKEFSSGRSIGFARIPYRCEMSNVESVF